MANAAEKNNSEIKLISVNIESLLNRKTIEKLDAPSKNLIKALLKNAEDNASSTNKLFNDVKSSICNWELINYTYNRESERYKISADKHINSTSNISEGLSKLIKNSVPNSYVVFLCFSLIIETISISSIIYGIIFDAWLINIWINAFLAMGSIGMIVTVLTAMYEWRKKLSEKIKKNNHKKSRRRQI